MEPGVGAPWRDIQIEHAKLCYGRNLTKALNDILKRSDLKNTIRIGALRLAGHIADPTLALAIEACWAADDTRNDHLDDYLWAFSECCGDDPARYFLDAADYHAYVKEYMANGRVHRGAAVQHRVITSQLTKFAGRSTDGRHLPR